MILEEQQKVFDFFRQLNWPDLKFEGPRITTPLGALLEYKNGSYRVEFFQFNREEGKYERKARPIIECKDSFDLTVLISIRYTRLDIRYFDYIKDILNIDFELKKIKVVQEENKLLFYKKSGTLIISEETLLELINDSVKTYRSGRSSKDRLERHLKNKLRIKYRNSAPKEVTTVGPGDFSFLVERFNIKIKKNKAAYIKHLNEEDISLLGYFFEKLLQNEVFPEEFIRKLDDYFIKEKLKEILKLGYEILNLGSGDIKTNKAARVIAKINQDRNEIKQLENVWQKYFEKNLLYLIFSYKRIFPKVEFSDIDSDKKFPDFVGINHYNGLDVIEIKTHLANVLTWDASHKNFSFSAPMSKAIIQTMNYMDAIVRRRFVDSSIQTKITNSTEEENLYHPRGIIIISSEDRLTSSKKLSPAQKKALKRDFTKLRNSVQNIEILTFNEILDIANDYIQNIGNKAE